MSENGASPVGPAAALRGARRAAGLTQEQLAERSQISVRTLRGLESGRIRTPHRNSLDALVDALGLTGEVRLVFLDRWRPLTSASTFANLVEAGHDVETVLRQRQIAAAEEYRDLVVHEKYVIGTFRQVVVNENLVVMQALRDGVANRLTLWGDDPAQDVSRVSLEATTGCVVDSVTPLPDIGLVAGEVTVGELSQGAVHAFGYRIDATAAYQDRIGREVSSGGPLSTQAVHGFRRPVDLYVLQVDFTACSPPSRIWQVTGHGEARRRLRPLDTCVDGSIQIVCANATAGVHGVEWEW